MTVKYSNKFFFSLYASFSLFGYISVAALSSYLFEVDATSPLAIMLRAIVLLASIFYILKFFVAEGTINSKRLNVNDALVFFLYLVFWGGYLIRLVTGVANEMVPNSIVAHYFVSALFICLIPSLGLAQPVCFNILTNILKVSFYVLLFGLVLSVFYGIGEFLSMGLTSGRISLSRLSPIQLGKYSAFLCILSAAFTFKSSANLYSKSFYFIVFIFSLFSVFVSGSRTAFVALLLLVFLNALFNSKSYKTIFVSLFLPLLLMLLLYFLSIYFPDIDFLNRYLTMGSEADQSANIRYMLYEGAIAQFSDYPIFGDFFLEREFMYSPHNLYLEILMSMGVFGLFVFALLISYSLYKGILCVRNSTGDAKIFYMALLNIYLYLLVASIFSMSVITAPELWSVIVIYIFMPLQNKRVNRGML